MKVGIGIPAYNAERFLARTLESIRAQSFTKWQAVVVSDGSTDRTEEIAQEFSTRDSRIRAVTQSNAGVCAARNRAFEELQDQEAFVFLDADDLWEPEMLETVVGLLEANPETVAAHGEGRYIDANDAPFDEGGLQRWSDEPRSAVVKQYGGLRPDRTTFAVFAYRNSIPTAGLVLIRRTAIERAGLWDTDLSGAADFEYWLRVSSLGDFSRTERVLLNYRRIGNSMSSNPRGMAKDVALARKKIAMSRLLSDAQRTVLRDSYWHYQQAMQGHYRRMVSESLGRGDIKQGMKNVLFYSKAVAINLLRWTPYAFTNTEQNRTLRKQL